MSAATAGVRLPSLTAARFFAAFGVMAFHGTGFLGMGAADRVTRLGYVGVAFFFALSGFVLTWGTPSRLPKRTFYRRRFARIWPLLALVLLVGLALGQWTNAGPLRTEVVRAAVDAAGLQAWLPPREWYFGVSAVTWSLSAEAFYYALTPYLLARRAPQASLPLALAVIATAMIAQIVLASTLPSNVQQWATYIQPVALLPCFLAGHLAGRRLQRGPVRLSGGPVLGLLLASGIAASLLIGAFIDAGRGPFFFMGGIATLMTPAFLLLILWLAQNDLRKQPVLGARWLIRLGEWSFALYLIHPLVFTVVHKLGLDDVAHGQAAVTIAAWLVAIGVSGVAYTFIERPLEARLRGRRDGALVTTRPLPT